jgi:hypothetical protein
MLDFSAELTAVANAGMADSAHATRRHQKLCSDESMHQGKQSERRRTRRVRMKQGMRVRPTNPQDGAFEEIGTTTNMSQGGIYFVTERSSYREGMRLFVTVPYHSPHSTQNYEYLGQVARVDVLENGQKGVAVTFLRTSGKNQ